MLTTLGEEEAGFRRGRSTIIIDQLFTIDRYLKNLEFNQKDFINFIGFKQAFDSIWHDGMPEQLQGIY